MLYTTLKQLKEFKACYDGLDKIAKSLPGLNETDKIPLTHILQSNGFRHAIWALRTQEKKYSVEFALGCAERVLYIFEELCLNDPLPRNAIDAVKRYLIDPSIKNQQACSKYIHSYYEYSIAASSIMSAARVAYSNGSICTSYAADAAAYACRAVGPTWGIAYNKEAKFQKELFLRIVS